MDFHAIIAKDKPLIDEIVAVKASRMSNRDAIRETLRQRYIDPMSVDYLDDLYKACCVMYKKYEWFRKGANDTLLAIQKGG